MQRIKFFAAIAMVVGSAAVARSAATLPPESVSSDTLSVIHMDTEHFNPQQLQAAATAILGQNANKVDDPLKEFGGHFDKMSAAGAKAITLVMQAPKKADAAADNAPPPGQEPITYIELKQGADVNALKAEISSDMKPEQRDKTVFEQADNFLAMHDKSQTFPVQADAARAAIFAEALGTVSDSAIQIAFVADAATRDKMLQQAAAAPSKQLQDAMPLIANAKWITVAINLGNTPTIAATVKADNDANAKSLTDDLNNGIADLKNQIANPPQNANPMLLMAGPVLGPLLDSLKPAQTGPQVTVTINTQTMKTVANFAATMGMLGGPRGRGAGGPPGGARSVSLATVTVKEPRTK